MERRVRPKLPNGTLAKLSKETGISVYILSDYIATRRRPGRKKSLVLEKASGISAMMWLFGTKSELRKLMLKQK
jgi:hypothetical protein